MTDRNTNNVDNHYSIQMKGRQNRHVPFKDIACGSRGASIIETD